MNISEKAKELAEVGSYGEEVYQAFIDNYSEEDADLSTIEEAYVGEFVSDEAFARDMAEQTGSLKDDDAWPYTCIDWEQASKELMYDYFEIEGHYFRNI